MFVSDVFKIRLEVGSCGFENSFIWEVGAFVVLMSWFNLVIFLGKMPHSWDLYSHVLAVIDFLSRYDLLARSETYLAGFPYIVVHDTSDSRSYAVSTWLTRLGHCLEIPNQLC